MRKAASPRSTQQGVVLIEALVAILIFSIGVLAIVGLQATMVKNTADAKYRSEASYIAQETIGKMWADPTNLASYVTTTDISARLPSGSLTVAAGAAAGQYQVTVNWQLPGADEMQHTFMTTVQITGN